MNAINNVSNKNFLNIDREKQLKEACEQFEALFYDMVLKSARKTIPNNGIIKRNFGEEVFTEMIDTKFSETIAKSSKNGLKDLLFEQLKGTLGSNYSNKNFNQVGKFYPKLMA